MAEEVERDHPVAALREIAGQRQVHALREQQAVKEDDRMIPRTVL